MTRGGGGGGDGGERRVGTHLTFGDQTCFALYMHTEVHFFYRTWLTMSTVDSSTLKDRRIYISIAYDHLDFIQLYRIRE